MSLLRIEQRRNYVQEPEGSAAGQDIAESVIDWNSNQSSADTLLKCCAVAQQTRIVHWSASLKMIFSSISYDCNVFLPRQQNNFIHPLLNHFLALFPWWWPHVTVVMATQELIPGSETPALQGIVGSHETAEHVASPHLKHIHKLLFSLKDNISLLSFSLSGIMNQLSRWTQSNLKTDCHVFSLFSFSFYEWCCMFDSCVWPVFLLFSMHKHKDRKTGSMRQRYWNWEWRNQ